MSLSFWNSSAVWNISENMVDIFPAIQFPPFIFKNWAIFFSPSVCDLFYEPNECIILRGNEMKYLMSPHHDVSHLLLKWNSTAIGCRSKESTTASNRGIPYKFTIPFRFLFSSWRLTFAYIQLLPNGTQMGSLNCHQSKVRQPLSVKSSGITWKGYCIM